MENGPGTCAGPIWANSVRLVSHVHRFQLVLVVYPRWILGRNDPKYFAHSVQILSFSVSVNGNLSSLGPFAQEGGGDLVPLLS